MTRVTPASIAYIATQVSTSLYELNYPYSISATIGQARFALSSSSVFSRTDTQTDSERFYNSVLELFEDIEEREEVEDLLVWWNRYGLLCHCADCGLISLINSQIFPSYSSAQRPLAKDSALAKIKEKRARIRAAMQVAR
jgi:hypothetical protein